MAAGRARAAAGALALVLLAATAGAQIIQPRLTSDGTALILLDEIPGPPPERQPLVVLEFPPDLGARQIRVAASGLVAPPSVDLACGSRTWTIARSDLLQVHDRVHVFFGVATEIAEAVLALTECRLVLAGVKIPIPTELLRAVWGVPGGSGAARR